MTSSPETVSGWIPFGSSPGSRAFAGAEAGVGAKPDSGAGIWLPTLRSTARGIEESAADALERLAYERGFAAGVADERGRTEQRSRNALQTVANVAIQLESIQLQFARDRERDLHGLAIAIARQMLQRELTLDPELTGELVRRALALLPLDTTIEVRMHPEDLAMLGTSVAEFGSPGRALQLTWVGDPTLERGGFLLETPARVVDGRADVALRQLYERLDHD